MLLSTAEFSHITFENSNDTLFFHMEDSIASVDHMFCENVHTLISDYESLAIYSENVSLSLTNSEFINLSGGTEGGAVFCETFLDGVNFDKNYILIENCTFEEVTSTENGGAVQIKNIEAVIENSVFEYCETEGIGGAIYFNCDDVVFGEY